MRGMLARLRAWWARPPYRFDEELNHKTYTWKG